MSSEAAENDREEIVDEILTRLSREFVETALDLLDEIDQMIDGLENGEGDAEDVRQFIQREIHNIKGQGSTFGYPLTGRVGHMLEDYLINTGSIQPHNYADIRGYLDLMVSLIQQNEPLDDQERLDLLNSLPTGKVEKITTQKARDINMLLVMPSGLQRKMVSRELVACGFRVMRAYDCIEAISVALDIQPDVIFVNYDMTPFTGTEFCHVVQAIDKLRNQNIVLLTSYDADDIHIQGLPDNVYVVQKHRNFTDDIGELLIDLGLFGKLAS